MLTALLAIGPALLPLPGPTASAMFGKAVAYTSPTVIAASVALLMAFSRMHFQSHWVNRIAASAFAVYLLHAATPFLGRTMKPFVLHLAETHATPAFVALTLLYVVGVFAACVLIDQLRIRLWRPLSRRLGER